MRAHPECGVPPGQFVELSLENLVLKRFGRTRGTGRIHRLTWPKVTPDYPGNFTVFLLQAATQTLEMWDRYEPIKMSEKAKGTEQWLKDDGLVNNDGTAGLKWDTIPDPFCHYFPFEVRHPGKAPYLDPKFRFRVRNLSPKTNKPKASRKAPLRRSARLQALSSPGTSRTRTKSAARSKKGKK